MKIKNFKNKGFTLLLAVLITSIVMAISFGFSAFIIRELHISAIGRESMKALFASDSGAECAFYWEFKSNAFATTSDFSTITCAGWTINLTPKAKWEANQPISFASKFNNGSCAFIKIDKKTYYPTFRIESFGRNIGDEIDCSSNSPNRVERTLRIEF